MSEISMYRIFCLLCEAATARGVMTSFVAEKKENSLKTDGFKGVATVATLVMDYLLKRGNGSTITQRPPTKKNPLRWGPSAPTSPSSVHLIDDGPEKNHSVCPPSTRPAFLRHRLLTSAFPLERSPKFRTRYFVISQHFVIHSYFHCRVTPAFFLTRPCFAEKRQIHWSRGREKELISSPLLFIFV
ncbi:hypothetical protein AVEN_151478-1 [Araneus ventricosus]|uniref:Uncharacterized protein n=1 Tax=Araneus ventricosus TaxID=182803 RepID=A0A4Y2HYD5_ARAVE|nr:hypothetical protein AVEN_151478-1 [Araneus ventricosus]